jgi:dimethylamine/trimethylamine dehydrogenase
VNPPETVECDSVVLVTQRLSDDSLYRQLLDNKGNWDSNGIESVFRIGDCVAPGLIADAVFDGHRLAREIDSSNPEIPLPFIRERQLVRLE